MKIIDYIKEHKSLIIIITILIAAFILIGILIFNGNEDQNYNRKFDESKTKYKINEVVPIYVNQEQMAKKYLSEYVNLIVFDEEKAFELLDESFSQRYFSGNFDAFSKYINSLKTKQFVQAKVTGYDIRKIEGKTYYYVKDLDGNQFLFKESEIRNYTVVID